MASPGDGLASAGRLVSNLGEPIMPNAFSAYAAAMARADRAWTALNAAPAGTLADVAPEYLAAREALDRLQAAAVAPPMFDYACSNRILWDARAKPAPVELVPNRAARRSRKA